MPVLFISDLHLSDQRPAKLRLFREFMEGPAREANALYILGDLFEDFWIGVEDKSRINSEIIGILHDFSERADSQLNIMCGNRDFLLNDEFIKVTGCTLIPDPTVINLSGTKVLLMHGDTLCTDDVEYQKWRKFITHPLTKKLRNIIPCVLLKKLAHWIRHHTVKTVQKKPREIMDVTQTAVEAAMTQFNADTLIHGHTHRQAIHQVKLKDRHAQRIVLGDWYENDCVLIHDKSDYRYQRVEDYIGQYRNETAIKKAHRKES